MSGRKAIEIRGAAEHNLKHIDVTIPHNAFTVVTGVSGSGKSSLVYDTIFHESMRRFMGTFSTYTRQYLRKVHRPEVKEMTGLLPAVSVDQRTGVTSPRSTVGTLSGLYDLLRLMFARFGVAPEGVKPNRSLFSFNTPDGACPACGGLGVEDSLDLDKLIADPARTLRDGAFAITTPSGYIMYSQVTMAVLDEVCRAHGFSVDIAWRDLTEEQKHIVLYGSEKILIPYGKHPLESRMKWTGIKAKPREEGYYRGILPVMEEILKRDRNKNILRFVRSVPCKSCGGTRLNDRARSVTIAGRTITDASALPIAELAAWVAEVAAARKSGPLSSIAAAVGRQAAHCAALGIDYLPVARGAETLSGGELQRLRLATQLENRIRGMLYILDEPSAGLHPADHRRLITLLKSLRDTGNTVIAVDHNLAAARHADHLIDIGPGPGDAGGEVVFAGTPADILRPEYHAKSATARTLVQEKEGSPKPNATVPINANYLWVRGATKNNLQRVDAAFLHKGLTVVTGVSGAGKSTLVECLVEQLETMPAAERTVGSVRFTDQSPIGRNPRSNPATYTKLFDDIRKRFAALPTAVERGLTASHFSFNVPGGRCEACEGAGVRELGLHFLGRSEVVCEACDGKRFSAAVQEVELGGRNIAAVLDLSIAEALLFFADDRPIGRFLDILCSLGLGYITLGQPATTLSGGEAQRLKLAAALGKKEGGNDLYIFDEPTVGLHPADTALLAKALNDLVRRGNTVVAVTHDLRLIHAADHLIDMGPGSGHHGGKVVATGTPAEVLNHPDSLTAAALRAFCAGGESFVGGEKSAPHEMPLTLNAVTTNNLKQVTVSFPENRWTMVTGRSGSGKSSLVFDTLYAIGRNSYLETFPSYLRSRLDTPGGAEAGSWSGLLPAVGIGAQDTDRGHPRSTVGTVTDIQDHYRLLFARSAGAGWRAAQFSPNHEEGACPECRGLGFLRKTDPLKLISHPDRPLIAGALDGTPTGRSYGEPDGKTIAMLQAMCAVHGIDLTQPYNALSDAARDLILNGAGDTVYAVDWHFKRGARDGAHRFTSVWKGLLPLVEEEYLLRHDNTRGKTIEMVMSDIPCAACTASGLNAIARSVTVFGTTIDQLSALPAAAALKFFSGISAMKPEERTIVDALIPRLEALVRVGLGYLSPDRKTMSLSGGEYRRLGIAAILFNGLTGVCYVIDEPGRGLHPADRAELGKLLREVPAAGNTLITVDHAPQLMRMADRMVELGPGAGSEGGRITAAGTPDELLRPGVTLTGDHLHGTVPERKSNAPEAVIHIEKADAHNLKSLTLDIPVPAVVALTGRSGSGKSSLLFAVIAASGAAGHPQECAAIAGLDRFSDILSLERMRHTASVMSTLLTATGLADRLRNLFAATPEAKERGFTKSHFSFLTASGRCETCKGSGRETVALDFLPDVEAPCPACNGARFNPEVLTVRLHEKSIADIHTLTVRDGTTLFSGDKVMAHGLAILEKAGLGYLTMGQATDRCSAGELQRLHLAARLIAGKGKEQVLYLLDEPEAGLHPADIAELCALFSDIARHGSTILMATHSEPLIAAADTVIDLGPGGGPDGGKLLFTGTPWELMRDAASATGKALKEWSGR
ncbi:MAG TPA: ATP-binding cassette domain-containing protein [bacterium]|nr:ATP-binding cassette domain-containing protein [bacterium]